MPIYINIILLLYIIADWLVLSKENVELIAIKLGLICIISMITFLIKHRKNRIFCFELFFFIFIFICTYIYPLFLYGKVPHPMFSVITDSLVIKSLYVATSCIVCYIIGASLGFNKKNQINLEFNTSDFNVSRISHVFNILTFITFMIFIITGGWLLLLKYSDGVDEFGESINIFFYLKIFLLISTIFEFIRLNKESISTYKLFTKKINKLYLFNFLIISSFLLMASDRGELIQQVFPFIILYTMLINPIKSKYIVLLILLGSLTMIIIKNTRSNLNQGANKDNELSNLNLVNAMEDFLPATAGLYILIDHTDKNGNTGGKQAVHQVLSFIPYLQSITSELFNLDLKTARTNASSQITTLSVWGDRRSGLGTNVIGDLYYSFGWIGAMLILFLTGRLMSYLDKSIFFKSPLKLRHLLPYALIFGCSIYFCRVEFFYQVRTIGFSYVIIFLVSMIIPYKRVLPKKIRIPQQNNIRI